MNLKGKPFYLNNDDITWVEQTLDSMSINEKVGQLFCMVTYENDDAFLTDMVTRIKPGGLMCRPMPLEETVKTVNLLQETTKIPMLLSANLESGGNGVVEEGTKLGSPMQIAATDDSEMAKKLGIICGETGSAVGLNWTFAPTVDLDFNFRNPITNTRCFGSDKERVKEMGKAYIEVIQQQGIAATVKHFPGDGVDERDHHLVTSSNDMSWKQWNESFGDVFRDCIDSGVMSIMIGHITLPNYERHVNPDISDADILPASLSRQVVSGLLRRDMGFDGLIVTDATTMAGMCIPMPRSKAVPAAIAAGCDMFLFTKNMEEDLSFMRAGVEDGTISTERLDSAVTRILAMKAALKLHTKKLTADLSIAKKVITEPKHKVWAKECADKSITLVKEEKGVLPISPETHKKILFYGIEAKQGFAYSVKEGVAEAFKQKLIGRGFEVDQFDPNAGREGWLKAAGEIEGKYDIIVYLANLATKSNQTVVRIEWDMPMGANVPVYIESVPTIFISVENPYHLLDVPRVKTFINAYSSTDEVLESLIEKLVGESQFVGKSPTDPFCGRWDAKV